MRILHLIPTLTGAGAERQLAALSTGLHERGSQVMAGYVHHGPGTWPAAVPTHRFTAQRPWDPRLILEIMTLIRRWRADVVQTWLPRMDVAGGIAAALTGVPVVMSEPNSGASYGNDPKSRLRVLLARRMSMAIAANAEGGERYWKSVAPELVCRVIPNSVSFASISTTTPAERPPHKFIGIYAGRLEPEKRVEVFLRACATVMASRDLFVWICGDGSERGRLTTLACELGISHRVYFTGFVGDVWRYLRAADFSALLSDYEGEPNAVLESFAAGVPAIVSDTESHRPFRDQAVVVPHLESTATATAISDLLDDPGAVFHRVASARRFARSRGLEAHVAQYTDLYTSVAPQRSDGLRIAIDGSNLRSGGAITHISELLKHANPAAHGIDSVTMWGAAVTLARTPHPPWLERVHVPQLDRSLLHRVAWQYFGRRRLSRGYDVLFSPGATPARGFEPFVTMSQNMQPFDVRERARYPFSWAAMKLWLLRYAQARAFRQSAAVIFLTPFARDWIGAITHGIASRSSVIPHGVSEAFHHAPRRAHPLDSYSDRDPFRMVYVSDFYLYKHQWTIAEAVCRLREEGLPVTLDLIGASVDSRAVRRLEKTLRQHAGSAQGVRVIGTVPHEELPDLYRNAGAFVFGSTCENLPLTLIEAMASGLPIAAAAERPMTDILGDGALYFDPEDATSAADALRSLALDHHGRARRAQANYEASAAYSWQRCADDTFALLARVGHGHAAIRESAVPEIDEHPQRRRQQAQG